MAMYVRTMVVTLVISVGFAGQIARMRWASVEDSRAHATEAGLLWGDLRLAFVDAEFNGVDGVSGLGFATDVEVSPDGKHVYATGFTDNSLSVFSRDSTSAGRLSFVESEIDGVNGVDGLLGAQLIAVSPDGKHVYATGFTDSGLAAFSRDSSTGALNFVESELDGVGGVDGIGSAVGAAVSPDGKHVYATGAGDSALAVFSRDSTSGELGFVESHFDDLAGVDGLSSAAQVTVSPDGKHVYVAGRGDHAIAVFSRNPVTGNLGFVEAEFGPGPPGGFFFPEGIAISPDGKHVYSGSRLGDSLAVFSRDAGSGILDFVEAEIDGQGGVDGLDGASGVEVSPDGKHVIGTGPNDNAIAVFSRNAVSGELGFVEAHFDNMGGVDGLARPISVAMSPNGMNVYSTGADENALAVFVRRSLSFFRTAMPSTGPRYIATRYCQKSWIGVE